MDTEKVLSMAVNMEMGHQMQQRIPSNNNKVSSNTIKAIQQFSRFRGANVRTNHSSRNTFNQTAIGLCRGCGQNWTPTHRQVCPAMGKKCNHCGLLNHFAKVCRKKLNNSKNSRQDAPINHVEISETTEQPEIQNVYFTNYNEQYNFEYESSDDNYLAIVMMTDDHRSKKLVECIFQTKTSKLHKSSKKLILNLY